MYAESKTPRHGLRMLVVFLGVLAATSCESPPSAGGEGVDEPGVARSAVGCASGTLGGKQVWAHFNNPPAASNYRDYTITDELKRLIRETPGGATIRGTIHSLSMVDVAEELRIAEQSRGVVVRLVLDGPKHLLADRVTPRNDAVRIIQGLRNVRFCFNSAGAGSCMSTSASGNMHTKMFTFSQTKDPNGNLNSNVAWFGSANFTDTTGPAAFNNTVTVYGDAALVSGLNTNFEDMFQRRYVGTDYYDSNSGRGYYMAEGGDAYASPEGGGQTDTIVTRLNDITPDGNCEIRIGMAFVTTGRPNLLSQIKHLRAYGCRIWMVVSQKDDGTINMAPSVLGELLSAGVVVRKRPHVHDKYFAVYGKYGSSYAYRVYTGSQNWSQDALNENEEIFVKLAPETGSSHPIYDGFVAHFADAFDAAVTCTSTSC
jgi:phosphatidylserine/phosphatidylglycerophosphate/cardiolipin synthase-like enzyme